MEAGRKIMLSRIKPCVIRLYDEISSTRVVESVLGLKVKGAYMILGFDGPRKLVEAEESIGFQIVKELGGEDLGSKAGERWWEHRYDFYVPHHMFALPWMHGTPDTVTTFDKIEDLDQEKHDVLTEKYASWDLIHHAHFSHWFPWGVMMYDRFVIEDPPQDPEEAQALHDQIWDDAVRISLKYNGVLNEHHGIGIKLGYLMPEQYGDGFEALLAIKDALDPNGIMNPGKLGFPNKIMKKE
jgi:alkyldihydroxyacetonephosphate synthase